jgi:Zn-dependent peptidase ImmA (M78 family)
MREAGRLQRGLRWILQELDEDGVALPKVGPSADAEAVASRVRELLGVSVATQVGWKSEYVAFREWRHAIESIWIAVLALPMGSESARGFSAWDEHAPAIAVNTHWGPSARIFTLFHELGHLVSRTSSVCDESFVSQRKDATDPVERWCESFAAALLLPWTDVEHFLRRQLRWDGRGQITDLGAASKIARRFKVSLRATVLRLIGKERASWTLYRAISPATETKHSAGGGSGRTRSEARFDEYGRRAAHVLLRGLERDVLSRDDVLAYLNIGDGEFPDFQKQALSA